MTLLLLCASASSNLTASNNYCVLQGQGAHDMTAGGIEKQDDCRPQDRANAKVGKLGCLAVCMQQP